MRIISLAPTQTEIIAALGQLSCLVGRTENCDFPETVSGVPVFGSWHAPDIVRVIAAKPDLVCTFAKHHEEVRDFLLEEGLRVYHGDPDSVAASLRSILELAEMLACKEAGESLVEALEGRLRGVAQGLESVTPAERPQVFRIMNWDPLITVGPGSFQHDVIAFAGGRNIFDDGPSPYFVCDPHDARTRNPELIFFCEPHILTLLESDPAWRQVSAVHNGRIAIFDCGLTCRSGPRIVDMVEELAKALHFRHVSYEA
jgi:iron complex transport system substrate-binding protein